MYHVVYLQGDNSYHNTTINIRVGLIYGGVQSRLQVEDLRYRIIKYLFIFAITMPNSYTYICFKSYYRCRGEVVGICLSIPESQVCMVVLVSIIILDDDTIIIYVNLMTNFFVYRFKWCTVQFTCSRWILNPRSKYCKSRLLFYLLLFCLDKYSI